MITFGASSLSTAAESNVLTSVSRHFARREIITAAGKRLPLSQRATVARVTNIRSANSRCESPLFVRSLRKVSANNMRIVNLTFCFFCSLTARAVKDNQPLQSGRDTLEHYIGCENEKYYNCGTVERSCCYVTQKFYQDNVSCGNGISFSRLRRRRKICGDRRR